MKKLDPKSECENPQVDVPTNALERAWTLSVWRTPLNSLERFYSKLTNEKEISFVNISVEKLVCMFIDATDSTYPDPPIAIPEDDRMDFSAFHNPKSTPWKKFKKTKAYQSVDDKEELRYHISQSLSAIGAVVLRRNYEKFCAGSYNTLGEVISNKFPGRQYQGNFPTQPSIARGSAFLLRNDLLLTAAHNLADENGWICDDKLLFVFGYHDQPNGDPPTGQNTFSVSGEKLKYKMRINDDWMLIKLTTPVDAIPLKLSHMTNHPPFNTGFYSAGFPLGLPMKLTMVGHHVLKLLDSRFAVNLDMFQGNSGSPIIDINTNEVHGIFTGGFPDLVFNKARRVGIRSYRYEDIAKGIGGEHCQAVSSFRSRIDDVLIYHGLQRL